MGRFLCDYCDVFLSHDSLSVRKQHMDGNRHRQAVAQFYQQFVGRETQEKIDRIVEEFEQRVAAGLVRPTYGVSAINGMAGDRIVGDMSDVPPQTPAGQVSAASQIVSQPSCLSGQVTRETRSGLVASEKQASNREVDKKAPAGLQKDHGESRAEGPTRHEGLDRVAASEARARDDDMPSTLAPSSASEGGQAKVGDDSAKDTPRGNVEFAASMNPQGLELKTSPRGDIEALVGKVAASADTEDAPGRLAPVEGDEGSGGSDMDMDVE